MSTAIHAMHFLRLSLLVFCCVPASLLAQTGSVSGKVTDASTREPIISANVFIEKTAIGTVTSREGDFQLRNVPAGTRTLVVSYIGYTRFSKTVEILPDSNLRVDVQIRMAAVEGEEVVVTAQLEGQVQAINQQLSSNTIVNVVSADRIRQLPDQNAAESLGRLPGISVQRDAGEGQKVIVRGLTPKFNAITLNGVRIPSTDPLDRSVDLTMISPDMLSGIEVFKALTPDMDAEAIGGTINLTLKRAREGFHADVRAQTGYNDQEQEYGQYKASVNAGTRVFEDAMGVVVSFSAQRANRSADILTADYLFKREGSGPSERSLIEINNLNVADRIEVRERYGGGLTLDYDIPDGSLFLNAFIGSTVRDELTRRKRYRVGSFTVEYDLRDREQTTRLASGLLSGMHKLGWLEVDWQGSYSNSRLDQPFANYFRFVEVGAFNNGLVDDQGPASIPSFAKNDLSSTWFQYATYNPELVVDQEWAGQANLKFPYSLGEDIVGDLKIGGKYRGKSRSRDVTEYRTPFADIDDIAAANPGRWTLYRATSILIENFLDPDFDAGDFLEGAYVFGPGLDRDKLNAFRDEFVSWYALNRFIELEDYDAAEKVAAGYIMTQVNLTARMTILGGVRYEHTQTSYDGNQGFLQGNLGEVGTISDTTGGQTYDDILPMVHLRYRFTPWLDLRLAATRTLSRPDYFNLVPYERINFAEQTIARGNPSIRRTTVWNYDAFLSFYSNDIGLFTLGGFYKKLQDIDYLKQARIVGGQFNAYQLTEPVNGGGSEVWGFEVDLQTNLRNLPEPFNGIVINANYAYIQSETEFPFFEIGPRSPNPPYTPQIIDTFRKGTLPGQADHVGNLSLGYERGGFSGRLSVTYQGRSLQTVGARAELDGYSDRYWRWDLTFSQRLFPNLSVYADWTNISNSPEESFLGEVVYPTDQRYYGWTADLGLRFTL